MCVIGIIEERVRIHPLMLSKHIVDPYMIDPVLLESVMKKIQYHKDIFIFELRDVAVIHRFFVRNNQHEERYSPAFEVIPILSHQY